MRMLMKVYLPTERFNALMRSGTIGETIGKILETTKPEAVYFTEDDGLRGAMPVVDVPDASAIPALSEPWFLSFGATVAFQIAMTPADLQQANLESFAKIWG